MSVVFSVVVPFLNEEEYIEKSIRSLVNQNFPEEKYEIIFVDNGSTDRSVEIVKIYSDKVKLLFESKPNAYNARNKGIKNAKGRILAFTDADCIVKGNWLQEYKLKFQDDRVFAVVGRIDSPKDSSWMVRRYFDYQNFKYDYVFKNLSRDCYVGFGGNMAIRKKIFKSLGLFKADYIGIGDAEIIQRIVHFYPKNKVVFADKAKVVHLEIRSMSVWFRKMINYGMYHLPLNYCSRFRNLYVSESLQVYKQYIRNKKGLSKIYYLFPIVVGMLFYEWGRLKEKFYL